MGSVFPFTVESHSDQWRRIGDFARLDVACNVARGCVKEGRSNLAVVKDRDGVLVFAVDDTKTWAAESGVT